MAKMQISIPHQLPPADALPKVKSLLGGMKTQFADRITGLEENWNGNRATFSFTAMGFAVFGTLEVKSSSVELNGTLPFAASLFKGKIEGAIREHASKLLR